MNYKTTIVGDRPDYLGKKLLLINKDKDGLFQTDEHYIEIEINTLGELFVYKLSKKCIRIKIDFSLRKIGETFLGLKDPSVREVLRYFILPEMEVERIFNNLRYNYLQAIQLSGFEDPQKFISSNYNKAFQALANINVYQGNPKKRKKPDDFWIDAGFTPDTKSKVENDFAIEKNKLGFILSYLKKLEINDFSNIYAEIIAMKPGIHELVTHPNYFDKKTIRNNKKNKERTKIFELLRGNGDLSDIKMNKLPRDIDIKNYFSYAPCNVTEGPFVFRKKISVNYFDEIRKIKSKQDLKNLHDNFYILDYFNRDLTTREKFREFLREAIKFKYFM